MKSLVVVAMSGGLDSFAIAHKALKEGNNVYIINFDYNQKHIVEKEAFKNLLKYLQTNFPDQIKGSHTIKLDTIFSDLWNIYTELRDTGKMKDKAYHQYYVPSRNLLFSVILSIIGELIYLSDEEYQEIKIGLNIHRHSEAAYGKVHRDYWDITPEFASKLNELLSLNDVVNISIYAPYVNQRKEDIVQYYKDNNLPYNLTWTCYNPIKKSSIKEDIYVPCLECEACKERELAGKKLGLTDINDYQISIKKEALRI